MVTPELLSQNRKLLNGFLVDRTIPLEHSLPDYEVPFGYIYCIENKINGKKYIGACYSTYTGIYKDPHPYNQLRKRASNYIYEYNTAMNATSSIRKTYRPIIKALQEEGFENFIIYPIAETRSSNHKVAEKYFIDKFDSVAIGYNVPFGGAWKKHKGRVLTTKDKLARSEEIIGVNLNLQQLVLADSMKLLADYLDTSKDIIKNNARSGRTHKGWFIFYTDDSKRNYILNHYVLGDNLGIQKRGTSRNHSDKSKQFYSDLTKNISEYINNSQSELFSDFQLLDPLRYEDDSSIVKLS